MVVAGRTGQDTSSGDRVTPASVLGKPPADGMDTISRQVAFAYGGGQAVGDRQRRLAGEEVVQPAQVRSGRRSSDQRLDEVNDRVRWWSVRLDAAVMDMDTVGDRA